MSLWKKILFPVFLLRLCLALIPFLIQLSISSFNWSFTLVFSILLLVFQLSFFVHFFWSQKIETIKQTLLLHFTTQNQQYLTEQKEKWLELQKKQPTHTEVLINLGTSYCLLGEEEKCQQYYAQAKYLDPNHQFFSQEGN